MSKKAELKQIKDSSGILLMVELKFQTRPVKGWFREHVRPMVETIKALVPATDRQYDPAAFSWTISASYWTAMKTVLEHAGWAFINKYDQTANVNVKQEYAESFYNAQEAAGTPSAEDLNDKLIVLTGLLDFAKLSTDEQKTAYRQACRKYHPDLGGDAAKMSELNRVWTLYNKQLVNVPPYSNSGGTL